MKDTALVLGNYRTTLVVIRSLAAAGHRIVLGVGGESHGNDRSRHVSEVWRHPPMLADTPDFEQALAAFLAQREDVRIVFPVTEEAVVYFTRRAPHLPARVTLASVASELVERCQSKERTLRLATEADVPVAEYRVVDSVEQLRRTAAELGYPVIVRPLVAPSRVFGRKAIIAREAAQLEAAIPAWPTEHDRLLVQDYVHAPRYNLYFVARRGRVEACVHVRIDRTDRVDGTGLAVEGITVPPSEPLSHYCNALVAHLDYTGVGCAQFLVDDAGDRITFIEINPRLGANCAIVQHCGVDLPRCACLLACGESLAAAKLPESWPADQRYAWTYGDLAGLRHELAAGRLAAGSALRWVGRLLVAAVRADVHLTFQRGDARPTFANLGRAGRDLLGRKRTAGVDRPESP